MMHIKTTLLSFIVLFLIISPVTAQERPRIGLVLSGGGARGAAHIGVLKVLEEMQIPIDVLVGTSMGSIVGGLYASGMTPSEIEATLNEMDWDELLTDDQSRQYLSLDRKRQQDLFTTNLNPGFGGGQIRFPPGVIQGQKIELAFHSLTSHVVQVTDFDNLVIPFRAVATDIVSGDAVVLGGGNLANAMRASMSVPSLFSPIKIDGRILVDGGVSNNLPVDVARQMGAEILIAVDVSTPLRDETQLGSLFAITDQLTRLLTGQNTRASRESLSEQDMLIVPDLGDITSSQFDRSSEAIPIGETEARNHAQELSQLSVSDSEYRDYRASLNQVAATEDQILKITLHNESRLGDAVIEERISPKVGEALDLKKIDDDIGEIYGLGVFEKVGYNLHRHQDGVDIDIYAIPKSWGPNYLHFGFQMDGDLQGDNGTNITLGYTRSAMNSLGGEWTSLLQLGEEPKVQSYFHQPLGRNLAYFVEPYISISRENLSVFNNDGDKFAEYRLKQSELELAVGREFGTRAAITLGLSRTTGSAELLVGNPLLPEADFDDGGVFLRFKYDTLDNINFPTTGSIIRASLYSATESMGARQDYEQWQLRMTKVRTHGRNTLVLSATVGGTENGPASLPKLFSLGGFFQLSGLRPGQRRGQYMGLLRTAYYRRFGGIKFLPTYIGATAEYGGTWQTRDEISRDTTTFAGSIFIGLDSPAGPVLFGLGHTNEGDTAFFTKIGRFF